MPVVPTHPTTTPDPDVLRWVIPDGLLAFTGAGAALILAALTLLALGLLMLWRSRVEEQSLFRAPDY